MALFDWPINRLPVFAWAASDRPCELSHGVYEAVRGISATSDRYNRAGLASVTHQFVPLSTCSVLASHGSV